MVQLVARLALTLLALWLAGCERGPDAAVVRAAVQQHLDDAFGARVLEVASLDRAGSVPLKDRAGRLIYFNARLKLERDYDFTRWDAHNAASLASLLGAGPKGVFGLHLEGNKAGDMLGVYGSAAFALDDGRYTWVPCVPAARADTPLPAAAAAAAIQPPPREAPPPTPVEVALVRLRELSAYSSPPPLPESERERILIEEFGQAYDRARARLDRAAAVIVIAGGPVGGAYAETLGMLEVRARTAKIPLDTLSSDGSLSNLLFLNQGSAAFALAQNDIVHDAVLGRGRFSGAPQSSLRAVASLFPETVHLVARHDRGITTVADLRGKRVDLGAVGSGTRVGALAILAVSGMSESDLAATGSRTLPDAATALAAGEIDAFFATIHAPARVIAQLAARTRLTFVPIGPSRELLEAGLVPLTLPALTYTGQTIPLPTLAATVLLVTRADVAAATVASLLRLLYEEKGGPLTAAVSQIQLARARSGVTLPFYPQADAWLAAHDVPALPAAP